jgi:hypothetical protein
LEQAEGYVNTLEKSTFRPSTSREVFEHHDKADGQRLKAVLKLCELVHQIKVHKRRFS